MYNKPVFLSLWYFLTMRPALNFPLEGVVLDLTGLGQVMTLLENNTALLASEGSSDVHAHNYNSVNNTAHLFTSVYWILFFSISGL